MKIQKEIIQEIKNGTSTVTLQLEEFLKTDSKIISLYKGEITIPQFMESISDSDPYKLDELYENKYMVINKKVEFPLEMKIPPELAKEIDKHYDKIKEVYPELSEFIAFAKIKIKEGCTSCNKNGYNMQIISAIVNLGGKNRVVDTLKCVFGGVFIEKLKEKEKNDKIDVINNLKNQMNPPKIAQNVTTSKEIVTKTANSPQKSCKNCVRKHLGKAIGLFNESLLGYPHHKWIGIGEMALAEDESIGEYPELAKRIREIRLQIMESGIINDTIMVLFDYIDDLESKGR